MGGAPALERNIRAFAGSGIGNKIIAIFDNDTIGLSHFQNLQGISLPLSIKAIRLPDIDLAKSYPTIGPQGHADLDVNGKAASMEMYLGRNALTRPDGALSPVNGRR